jgi:hypothetical protein
MRPPAIIVLACLASCGRFDFDPMDVSTNADAAVIGRCAGTPIFDDDFDAAGAGPIFLLSTTATEITASETGGELTFDLTGPITGRAYRSYRTVNAYPLAGLCVVVEVSRVVTCASCGTYMKIFDTSHAAEHYAYQDAELTLSMRTHVNATAGAGTIDRFLATPHDATTAFWQIRQVGNITSWETSADGLSFVQRFEVADLFTEPDVFVTMGAGTTTVTSNGGIAGFQRITATGP